MEIEVKGSEGFLKALLTRWEKLDSLLLPSLSTFEEVSLYEPHVVKFDLRVQPDANKAVKVILEPEAITSEILTGLARFACLQQETARRATPVCRAVLECHLGQMRKLLEDAIEEVTQEVSEAGALVVIPLQGALVRALAWSCLEEEVRGVLAPPVKQGLDLDFLTKVARFAPPGRCAGVVADNIWRPYILGEEAAEWFKDICSIPVICWLRACFEEWLRLIKEPRRQEVEGVATKLTQAVLTATGSLLAPDKGAGDAEIKWV